MLALALQAVDRMSCPSPRNFLAALLLLAPAAAEGKDCRTDAECGADFTCAKSCGAPGCSTPPNCPPPTPMCSETGTCEPRHRACAAAADCPSGLGCEDGPDGACSQGPSGQTMCTPGSRVCTLVQGTCQADAECGAGFECLRLGATDGCAAIALPDSGTACGSREIRACFPRRKECASDGDCGAGWTCFDFATSRSGWPEAWGRSAIKSCVPAAYAFTLRGHAYLKGPGVSSVGIPEGGGNTSGPGGGGAEPGGGAPVKGGDETTGAGAKSSSGCALASGRQGAGSALILVSGVLVAALLRASRRRR